VRSFIATLRSLTLPYGAPSGTPRIVIGPDLPDALKTLNRANVFPTKWQTSGAGIIAAILYYDANSNADDFFFDGITGGIFGANGYILHGWAEGVTSTSKVYIFHEVNPDANQRSFNGGSFVSDMNSGDARTSQGELNVFNTAYYGANDGLAASDFAPFQVGRYLGSGSTGPFTAYVPLGKVPSTLGGRRFFLAASTGTVTTVESIVNTWTDSLGNSGISVPTFPVFKNRTYSFRGIFTLQSSVGTDIISVKIRQQVGGAPNVGTDPVLASLGGDGRALDWYLDGPYEPAADASLKPYVTMVRAGGTGNVSLFGNGLKSQWCLEDLGAK
jgi:hypothetical protein